MTVMLVLTFDINVVMCNGREVRQEAETVVGNECS